MGCFSQTTFLRREQQFLSLIDKPPPAQKKFLEATHLWKELAGTGHYSLSPCAYIKAGAQCNVNLCHCWSTINSHLNTKLRIENTLNLLKHYKSSTCGMHSWWRFHLCPVLKVHHVISDSLYDNEPAGPGECYLSPVECDVAECGRKESFFFYLI